MTEIIMFGSNEAAKHVTNISGWVSRNGIFYGDGPAGESAARYGGCTHRECNQCGSPIEKHKLICDKCSQKSYIEKYNAMPRAEWDGVGLLYSDANDKYYVDLDEAECDIDDGRTIADLRLIICKPNYARQLDSDFFCDDMPDGDDDLPQKLQAAIDAFNEAVEGIVLSWSPGKFALAVDQQEPQG